MPKQTTSLPGHTVPAGQVNPDTTMSGQMDRLGQIPLFASLAPEERLAWFSQPGVLVRNYPAGSLLHLMGEPCNQIDLIVQGQIQIEHDDESGRYLVVTELGPGDLVGGQIVFSSQPYYPMQIIVKQQSEIIQISRKALLDQLQRNPVMLQSFLMLISDNAARLSEKIRLTVRPALKERILYDLSAAAEQSGQTRIELTRTKKAMAEHYGVQRTSLSRVLQHMKRDGLIDFDSHSITLKIKPPVR